MNTKITYKTLNYKNDRAQPESTLKTFISKITSNIKITNINYTKNKTIFKYYQINHKKYQSNHYITLTYTQKNIDTYNKIIFKKYKTLTKTSNNI